MSDTQELDNTGAILKIRAEKGCDLVKSFEVFEPTNAPSDLTGYTGAITFEGDGTVFPSGTVSIATNVVTLTVLKASIDAMDNPLCSYRLRLTKAGKTEPFLKGEFRRVD